MENLLDSMFKKRFCIPSMNACSCNSTSVCGLYNHAACILKGT